MSSSRKAVGRRWNLPGTGGCALSNNKMKERLRMSMPGVMSRRSGEGVNNIEAVGSFRGRGKHSLV